MPYIVWTARVCITIIDQRNHHLFQPLLCQVVTASLSTSEMAWPVRHLQRSAVIDFGWIRIHNL